MFMGFLNYVTKLLGEKKGKEKGDVDLLLQSCRTFRVAGPQLGAWAPKGHFSAPIPNGGTIVHCLLDLINAYLFQITSHALVCYQLIVSCM